MTDKTTRKAFAPRKTTEKKSTLRKHKGQPTISKVGEVKPPVGALPNPAINDLLKVRTCVNCGQGSIPLEFDTQGGVPLDQVKIHCRKCGHTWTLKEEKSPHRLL
jgi:hypothetical protein